MADRMRIRAICLHPSQQLCLQAPPDLVRNINVPWFLEKVHNLLPHKASIQNLLLLDGCHNRDRIAWEQHGRVHV